MGELQMSRWANQFKDHAFNAVWDRLFELLSAPIPEEKSATVAVVEEYARLRKVVEYVRGLLDSLDPELLPSSYLNDMQQHVQNAVNEVTAFNSNGNFAHLQNANLQADQFLMLACRSPLTAFGAAKAQLTRAATAYAETMERHAAAYASQTDDLLADSAEKLKALEGRMKSADDEMTKLDSRVDNVETTVQGQLSTFNSTFQTSESTRTATFDGWLAKFQERAIADYTKLTEQNGAGLLAMQSFQDDAEKVLGTVIDTAQAGAYAKYANEEKNSANSYRRAAIGSMVLAALVLFVPEFVHWIEQGSAYVVDWKQALYRVPFSLILFAPALYLAKESSRHRTNEVINRRRQHILTTIGPYLALLPEEKADAIKADVAKSIFSESLPVFEDKTPDVGAFALQFSQLLTTLTKPR